MATTKPIIYQLFPRNFTNATTDCVQNGTINENGCGKMNDITANVLTSIRRLGITHVWYTGVIEHANLTDYTKYGIPKDHPQVVKGNAGSPYAIKDYYDIDPDIAVDVPNRITEFKELLNRTHQAKLKAIIDFVPNHVARCYHSDVEGIPAELDFGYGDNKAVSFDRDNNFYYYPGCELVPPTSPVEGWDKYHEMPAKATGNDCFSPYPSMNDWYETAKLNYGVDYQSHQCHFYPTPDTWNKMLAILKYWANMGVDGFRCDMAFMVPQEFWEWVVPQIKEINPEIIFIAEIYDVNQYRDFLYRCHFDYLYDKVNLYDTLRGVMCGHISASAITGCWQRIDDIKDRMLNFLENHDEQRIASPQFAGNALAGRAGTVVSATIAKGPFMLYAGQELGETASDAEGFSGLDGRTTIFDYWSVPSLRTWYANGKCSISKLSAEQKDLRKFYQKILTLCTKERAIIEGGFFDLMYVNYHNLNPYSQYAYIRHHNDETLLIVANFACEDVNVNIDIPQHAIDILSLNAEFYTGVELLSGDCKSIVIKGETSINVSVNAQSAAIWKFTPTKK